MCSRAGELLVPKWNKIRYMFRFYFWIFPSIEIFVLVHLIHQKLLKLSMKIKCYGFILTSLPSYNKIISESMKKANWGMVSVGDEIPSYRLLKGSWLQESKQQNLQKCIQMKTYWYLHLCNPSGPLLLHSGSREDSSKSESFREWDSKCNGYGVANMTWKYFHVSSDIHQDLLYLLPWSQIWAAGS